MKKLVVAALMLMSFQVAADRTYRMRDGEVRLDLLENYLSEQYAKPVTVYASRSWGDFFASHTYSYFDVIVLQIEIDHAFAGSCNLSVPRFEAFQGYYAQYVDIYASLYDCSKVNGKSLANIGIPLSSVF